MNPNQKTIIGSLTRQNNITGKVIFKGRLNIDVIRKLENEGNFVTAQVNDDGQLTLYIDEFEFDYFL